MLTVLRQNGREGTYFSSTVYDADGRVVKSINAEGAETNYEYDLNGSVTKVTDALVTLKDWNGTTDYTLDVLGRIVTVNDHNGKNTRYNYDAVGNKTSMIYPDGTVAEHAYDFLGRLTNLKDAENQNTIYGYDAVSRLIEMAYPNGWKENYAYDDLGQLTAQTAKDPVSGEVKHNYVYDSQGNVTRETRTGAGGQDPFDRTHTYDALNRLTGTIDGLKTIAYQYDSLGNLIFESNTGSAEREKDYGSNNLNQQIVKTTKVGDIYYRFDNTFDKCRNLIKTVDTADDAVIAEYDCDATNRMVKGINEKGEQSSYVYNGAGDLISNKSRNNQCIY